MRTYENLRVNQSEASFAAIVRVFAVMLRGGRQRLRSSSITHETPQRCRGELHGAFWGRLEIETQGLPCGCTGMVTWLCASILCYMKRAGDCAENVSLSLLPSKTIDWQSSGYVWIVTS